MVVHPDATAFCELVHHELPSLEPLRKALGRRRLLLSDQPVPPERSSHVLILYLYTDLYHEHTPDEDFLQLVPRNQIMPLPSDSALHEFLTREGRVSRNFAPGGIQQSVPHATLQAAAWSESLAALASLRRQLVGTQPPRQVAGGHDASLLKLQETAAAACDLQRQLAKLQSEQAALEQEYKARCGVKSTRVRCEEYPCDSTAQPASSLGVEAGGEVGVESGWQEDAHEQMEAQAEVAIPAEAQQLVAETPAPRLAVGACPSSAPLQTPATIQGAAAASLPSALSPAASPSPAASSVPPPAPAPGIAAAMSARMDGMQDTLRPSCGNQILVRWAADEAYRGRVIAVDDDLHGFRFTVQYDDDTSPITHRVGPGDYREVQRLCVLPADEQMLRVMCTISHQRLNVPAKGAACLHLACCNLDALTEHVGRRKGCPVAGCAFAHKLRTVRDIRLDNTLAARLRAVPDDVMQVVVCSDGRISWEQERAVTVDLTGGDGGEVGGEGEGEDGGAGGREGGSEGGREGGGESGGSGKHDGEVDAEVRSLPGDMGVRYSSHGGDGHSPDGLGDDNEVEVEFEFEMGEEMEEELKVAVMEDKAAEAAGAGAAAEEVAVVAAAEAEAEAETETAAAVAAMAAEEAAEEADQAGEGQEMVGAEVDMPPAPHPNAAHQTSTAVGQPSWWTVGRDDIMWAEVVYANNMTVVADVRDWVFGTAIFEQAFPQLADVQARFMAKAYMYSLLHDSTSSVRMHLQQLRKRLIRVQHLAPGNAVGRPKRARTGYTGGKVWVVRDTGQAFYTDEDGKVL